MRNQTLRSVIHQSSGESLSQSFEQVLVNLRVTALNLINATAKEFQRNKTTTPQTTKPNFWAKKR